MLVFSVVYDPYGRESRCDNVRFQMNSPGTTTSGQPLQMRPFTTKPTLIPQLGEDGKWNGNIVKIEQVLLRGLEGGARLHVWMGPDPRPHNHPWEWIDCKVLRGRYTADEYERTEYDNYKESKVTLSAGDSEHRVKHDTHHQITNVEPGTITVMSFGPIVGDGKQWGHLVKTDEVGYQVMPATSTMGDFLNALRHCNPHMRPADWVDPYAEMSVPNVDDLMASVGL
jgi:hypothetical protein